MIFLLFQDKPNDELIEGPCAQISLNGKDVNNAIEIINCSQFGKNVHNNVLLSPMVALNVITTIALAVCTLAQTVPGHSSLQRQLIAKDREMTLLMKFSSTYQRPRLILLTTI